MRYILANFNSIKVQLEQINIFHTIAFLRYFNSIKVQLEQEINIGKIVKYKFQFHKGTIRTR